MFVLFLSGWAGGVSWTTELIAKALMGSGLVFQQHHAIKKKNKNKLLAFIL